MIGDVSSERNYDLPETNIVNLRKHAELRNNKSVHPQNIPHLSQNGDIKEYENKVIHNNKHEKRIITNQSSLFSNNED